MKTYIVLDGTKVVLTTDNLADALPRTSAGCKVYERLGSGTRKGIEFEDRLLAELKVVVAWMEPYAVSESAQLARQMAMAAISEAETHNAMVAQLMRDA